MKILLVNDFSTSVGGAESYFFDLAEWLREAGHHVCTVSSDRTRTTESPRADRLLSHSGHFRGVDSLFQLTNYLGFRKIERAFQPDVIHFQNVNYALSPSVLHAARAPSVLTLHDYFGVCLTDRRKCSGEICHDLFLRGGCQGGCGNVNPFRLEHLRRTAFRSAARRLKALIAPSAYLLQEYDRSGYTALRHIPHPFPPSGDIQRERAGRFLFVGRLEEQKGVHDLVPAFRRYRDQGGTFRLRVIGRGSERRWMEEACAEAQLNDLVEFREWCSRDALMEEFDQAAALVMPSRWPEVFSIALLEACSHGLPVIGSHVGGIPEVISSGGNGILVPPRDPLSLAEAFMAVERALPQLLDGARQTSRKGPSPQQHVETLEKLYREVLGQ